MPAGSPSYPRRALAEACGAPDAARPPFTPRPRALKTEEHHERTGDLVRQALLSVVERADQQDAGNVPLTIAAAAAVRRREVRTERGCPPDCSAAIAKFSGDRRRRFRSHRGR